MSRGTAFFAGIGVLFLAVMILGIYQATKNEFRHYREDVKRYSTALGVR